MYHLTNLPEAVISRILKALIEIEEILMAALPPYKNPDPIMSFGILIILSMGHQTSDIL